MTDRYEKIRQALAMGPTPGPRRMIDGDSYPYVTVALPENEGRRWKDPIICTLYEDVTEDDYIGFGECLEAFPNASANASFIAACDTDTIRALLEERDAQQAEIERLAAQLTAAQRPAVDGCHCATCTCNPNMTPAVRFDLSPVQTEGAIREHLIRLGWTPPDENATLQAEIEGLREQLRLATVDQAAAEAEANDAHAENKRLREVLSRILENEAPSHSVAAEYGGYVLDNDLRKEARAVLTPSTNPNNKMTTKNNIAQAIARSESHNEIVLLIVPDPKDALDVIAEAKRIAAAAGLYCGVNDTNEGWDIYACDENEIGDKMDWRIDLRIRKEGASGEE